MESARKHWGIKLVATEKKNKLFGIGTYSLCIKVFLQISNSNSNEKHTSAYEQFCLFRFSNITNKWNCDVWILIWLRKTEI